MSLLRRVLSWRPAHGRSSAGMVIAVLATLSLFGSALAAALLVRDRGGSSGGASVAGAPSNSAPGTTQAETAAPGVTTSAGSGSATAVGASPATPGYVSPATPSPRTPTPAPSSSPVPPGTLTLTEADAGRSITVHRGETVVVQLHAMQAYVWSAPRSSNQAVMVQRSASQSSNGDAGGSFAAIATGTADLSATENPRCYPQCLPPSRYWSVHITVIS